MNQAGIASSRGGWGVGNKRQIDRASPGCSHGDRATRACSWHSCVSSSSSLPPLQPFATVHNIPHLWRPGARPGKSNRGPPSPQFLLPLPQQAPTNQFRQRPQTGAGKAVPRYQPHPPNMYHLPHMPCLCGGSPSLAKHSVRLGWCQLHLGTPLCAQLHHLSSHRAPQWDWVHAWGGDGWKKWLMVAGAPHGEDAWPKELGVSQVPPPTP